MKILIEKAKVERALEALKRIARDDTEHGKEYYSADAVDALLAEQQEPVAIVAVDGVGQIQVGWITKPQHNDKLYTSPPAQRKPLTGDEIQECWYKTQGDAELFARAIEAALNIKENT